MNIQYHAMRNIEQSSYCVDTLLKEFMNSRNSLNNMVKNISNVPEVVYPVDIS